MEVILTAFNSCFPLLLLVALGYLLKRIGYIGPTTINQMSKIVLDVFLPINIFMGVAKGKLSNDLSITYLILLFGIQVGAIIINCLIVGKRKMISQQKSIILQDAVRGNCSLFALPLSILIAGNTISSFAALSVAISSPVINTYSIVNFEYFKSKDHKIINILKKSLLSPLVLASFVGLVFMLFNLKLPTVLDNTLTFISNSVTAISLVMAGASFNFDIDSKKIPKIIYTLTFKMIFTPIITILLCILFKMNNFQTIVLVCMYSSPIAVSSFATAKGYDTDIDLASNCLVYSYVLAMITLPIIISVISLIGLI